MWQLPAITLALAITLTSTLPLDTQFSLPELENGGVHWAVIVAGSNGWYNYRHQADICHAYQILHKNGIPDERIVVMMYDDIAFNRQNPHPGVVINHLHGSNLYKGVPKDYTGDVSSNSKCVPQSSSGAKVGLDSLGSGKVIDSGPNDNIFVYFADHGAPGLIAFPNDYLYATKFISALKDMHEEKKYAKMLIYIEACESGSMFANLPKDINIFAVSASNDHESSYACYYDSELETYLGDVFSVSWMENSDKVSMNKESVQQQFAIVKKVVNTSHVQEFGDMSIGKMKLSAFQGPKAAMRNNGQNSLTTFDFANAVHSREVALQILKNKLEKVKSQQMKEAIKMELYQLYKEQDLIGQTFRYITNRLTQGESELTEKILQASEKIQDDSCYEEAVEHFRHACTPFRNSEHILGHLKTFVNLCNAKFYIGHITNVIDHVCSGLN